MSSDDSAPPSGPRTLNFDLLAQVSKNSFLDAYDKGVMGVYATSSPGRHVLVSGRDVVDFTRCSYLGLDNHQGVVDASIAALRDYGAVQWSCGRSRLNYEILGQLERGLGEIWGGRVIVFSSVTLANMAALPLFASGALTTSRPEIVAFDGRCHASLRILRPLIREFCEITTTGDSPLAQLQSLCASYTCVGFVTDGVNSLGGSADIAGLLELQSRANLALYVDDAHGVSICGEHGAGHARTRLGRDIGTNTILVHSLAKGYGASGGAVLVGTEEQERRVRFYAPTYGFSAVPSVAAVGAALGSLAVHQTAELVVRQNRLIDRIRLFDKLLPTEYSGDDLPLRFVRLRAEAHAIDTGKRLLDAGVYVMAAFFPTVAQGEAGVRIALTSEHTESDVRHLVRSLQASMS